MEVGARDVKPMNVGWENAGEEEEGIDHCVVAETCKHHDGYWWDFSEFLLVFRTLFFLLMKLGLRFSYRICLWL